MNIKISRFTLIYSSYLLFYIFFGQNILISKAGRNFSGIVVGTYSSRSISKSGKNFIKSADYQNLSSFSPFSGKPGSAIQITTAEVKKGKIINSSQEELSSEKNTDTIIQNSKNESNSVASFTDTIKGTQNSSITTLLDSVARTLISFSDLDSMIGADKYIDTVVHYKICYQEARSKQDCSGPYSQSVSNLKDY